MESQIKNDENFVFFRMQAFPKSRWCKQSVSSVERDLHPLDRRLRKRRYAKHKKKIPRYITKWGEDNRLLNMWKLFCVRLLSSFLDTNDNKVALPVVHRKKLWKARLKMMRILLFFNNTSLCPWIFFFLKLIIWNIDIHTCLLDSTFLCPHLF
jgi:hypothetical protein